MGVKYIQNAHIAPITVNARDSKGKILFSRTFRPARTDTTTGRVISTGYTSLTDEEYDQLLQSSRTFTHYKDNLKLLVVCDDIPPNAKTPQEALLDARREARKTATQVTELSEEMIKLKAALLDSETAYKKLQSASVGEEALKALEKENEKLKAERDAVITELKAVKKVLAEKIGGKGKEFT
jgi:hypothetical protein